MTDEERIAIATLHGCAFFKYADNVWYAREDTFPTIQHPVEIAWSKANPERTYFFTCREELALFYCAFYNLER